MRLGWSAVLAGLFLQATAVQGAPARPWSDPSPHLVRFVEVEPGVKLEVLDWGGPGRNVILLAGHGDSAHVYDEFAPRLARRFHVIAITRRGFGASSQPARGYDLRRLVEDIRVVMDALHLSQASLVGHSIAGEELDGFAAAYPKRLDKLVFLDAAYDRVDGAGLEARLVLPRIPRPTAQDRASPSAMRAYLARTETLYPEAEVRATRRFAPDGHYLGDVTPNGVAAAVAKISTHPDYSRLPACSLAIYGSQQRPQELFPFYPLVDRGGRRRLDGAFREYEIWKAAQRREFGREAPRARVKTIPGASHYVFISNPDQVLAVATTYLDKPPCKD